MTRVLLVYCMADSDSVTSVRNQLAEVGVSCVDLNLSSPASFWGKSRASRALMKLVIVPLWVAWKAAKMPIPSDIHAVFCSDNMVALASRQVAEKLDLPVSMSLDFILERLRVDS